MQKIYTYAKENKNIILTDFVQGGLLEELFSNAYIFVLPSDIEGMSICLLEAMSYGNCCLVSDIPENMEVVEDKAICFQKGNVEDLRRKLLFLLERTDVIEKYREISSRFICEKHSWEEVVDKTIWVYENVGKVRRS